MPKSPDAAAAETKARPRVVFNWTLHYACNYRCQYCWFDGRWEALRSDNVYPGIERLLPIWEKIHAKYGPCHIQTSGAEPTLYPSFLELLQGLTSRHSVSFTTNLSWSMPVWRSFSARLDPSRVSFSASFHPQWADFEEFTAKARFLKESGYSFGVIYVPHPALLDKMEHYCGALRQAGFSVHVQAFNGSHDGVSYPGGYSEQDRRRMYALNGISEDSYNADKLSYALDDRSPRGKPCTSGQLYCAVNSKGDIHRCEMDQTRGAFLGNLFGEFELRGAPSPCEASHCQCEFVWLVEEREKAFQRGIIL